MPGALPGRADLRRADRAKQAVQLATPEILTLALLTYAPSARWRGGRD
jgi:hypothetical protein